MKAMVIKSFGDSDVFELAELDKPEMLPGHVLVKVSATSVNTVDTMIRKMGDSLPLSPPLPAVLGMDFAGTVAAISEGVTKFAEGDEVYGCAGGLANLQGALAEFMLADAKLISHKPKSLSMREAAAIPLVGITAYEGLHRAQVGPGQKVLVHGGSGGHHRFSCGNRSRHRPFQRLISACRFHAYSYAAQPSTRGARPNPGETRSDR